MDVTEGGRELLGAYALDALDDDEVVAMEALISSDPEAAEELHRLRSAAAWIGATEALQPPRDLRRHLFEAAAARPVELRVYRAAIERHEELLDAISESDLELPTENGLSIGDLVVHLAAMETAVAETVGHQCDVSTEVDVEARTNEFLAAFGHDPLGAGRAVWHSATVTIAGWAGAPNQNARLPWADSEVSRRTALATRAFELWTHDDDIRVALGQDRQTPLVPELALMSDVAVGILPFCFATQGQKVAAAARVVLTGEGGGDWTVSLDGHEHDTVDVTLTLDVVDYCRVVAERLNPENCGAAIDGDQALGRTLLGCASALATL